MFDNTAVKPKTLSISCAKIACCSSESIFTFLYASSSIQNASELFVSCVQIYFVNFPLRQTPQIKNLMNRFKQPSLCHLSVLDTYSYDFLHTMTDTATAQNIDVSS